MLYNSKRTSCSGCCCPLTSKIVLVIFMILLIVAIMFGNSVTLAIILRTKYFHTPQGYLKASLAVADLTVGAFVVPLSLSLYAELSLLINGSPAKWTTVNSLIDTFHPCSFIGPVFSGCTLVSITTIFFLTIERTIAVLKPLHREAVITRKRTSTLILLSWLGSFFLAAFPILYSKEIVLEYNACSRMCNYALWAATFPTQAWNILLLFPAFDFTLLSGTVAINILSFSTIRLHSKRRQHLAESDFQRVTGPTFTDIKAAKTIGMLTLAFTASFTPIAVFVVVNVAGKEWSNFSFFAFWILTASSCCNVIIYSVRDHKFRHRPHQFLVPLRRKSVTKT